MIFSYKSLQDKDWNPKERGSGLYVNFYAYKSILMAFPYMARTKNSWALLLFVPLVILSVTFHLASRGFIRFD